MKGEVLTEITCEKCQRPMAVKSGRNGIFLACTGYPECRNTANFTRDEKGGIYHRSHPRRGGGKGDLREMRQTHGCQKWPLWALCGLLRVPGLQKHLGAGSGEHRCAMPRGRLFGNPCGEDLQEGKKFFALQSVSQMPICTWDEPFEGTCPECGTPVLTIKQPKKQPAPLSPAEKRGAD